MDRLVLIALCIMGGGFMMAFEKCTADAPNVPVIESEGEDAYNELAMEEDWEDER